MFNSAKKTMVIAVVIIMVSGFYNLYAQIVPNTPFTGTPGRENMPTGWDLFPSSAASNSPDVESIPTTNIFSPSMWSPDINTLTGLPAGVNRIAHTHGYDHITTWPNGTELIGVSVSGLVIGRTYKLPVYTAGSHYDGPATDGDVHSSLWAAATVNDIYAMKDKPTYIGRDVSINNNWVLEQLQFTATATTMVIALGMSSDSFRDYNYTGVLWAFPSVTSLISDVVDCNMPTALVCEAAASVAIGGNVTSTATGGTGGTVTWAISPTTGVSTSSGPGSTTGAVTFTTAGTYTVTFTSTNNSTPAGCNAPASVTCTRTITVSAAACSAGNVAPVPK